MAVYQHYIDSITKPTNAELFKSLETYTKDSTWKQYAMIMPSSGGTEVIEFLGQMPGFTEWVDQRLKKKLKGYDYTLKAKDWEASIDFDRNDLKDKYFFNKVKALLPNLARSAAEHPTELLFQTLVAGVTDLCYDGKAFFSATHPSFEDGEIFSNKLAGAGVTATNIETDINAVEINFLSLKKRNRFPIISAARSPRYVIWHSLALNPVMREVLDLATISTGGQNPYYNRMEHYATPFLTGNDWYCFVLSEGVKPFLFQNVKGVTGEWNLQKMFDEKRAVYGVDATYNMGYGYPHLAAMVDNT